MIGRFKCCLVYFLCLVCYSLSYSQNIQVAGRITDALSGEGIEGVNVVVLGRSFDTFSDSEGNYSLNAPPGSTLIFSKQGYKTYSAVINSSTVDVAMFGDAASNDGGNTFYHFKQEELLEPPIMNIFNKDFIGATGGSATGLIGRVSGAKMQGSLVSFRGLSPRYTSINVNGLATPITEQNIKAFSLGLMPSATIQEMHVYKSGFYPNYGEWGGGTINITTSADISEEFMQLTFGLTYQDNFTFQDFLKDENHGSKFGDHFGYGINRRRFTDNIVDAETLQSLDRAGSAAEGAKLPNDWPLETVTAGPGYNLGFHFGKILKQSEDGEFKFSTANSIRYIRMQRGAHFNRARWEDYVTDDQGQVIESRNTSFMTDGIYRDNARVQAHSDWFLRLNDDNEFDLSFIYGHQGENETMARYFVGRRQGIDGFYAQYGPTAKGMFLIRANGKHEFFEDTDLDWSLGYGIYNRDEPDLRRAASQRPLGATELPYILIIPESAKADGGARFASEMDDRNFSARIDLDHDFIDDRLELKVGVLYDYVDRDFGARLITSAKDDFTNPDLRLVPAQFLGSVFEPENFEREDGYFLVDGTTPFESYEASNNLFSAYAGLDFALGDRWNISAGLRYENFVQKLDSDTIAVDNSSNQLLPMVNIDYHANDRFAVKFAYSKSVNRPAFRELSPFIFYDFDYRADIQGNSDLQNATLDNIDLSLQYLFGKNEYVMVTPFYKHIENPIEMVYIIRSESQLFSFDNAPEADLAGVEVELAKFLGNHDIWQQLLFTGNFTYTSSTINLGEQSAEFTQERPLQGQTPLQASLGLTFIANDQKTQATVAYRYDGTSLFSVGDGLNTYPWYNMPVHYLNASFSHTFGKLKMTIVGLNLLNTEFVQREDANLDGKLDNPDTDQIVQRGLIYQTFDLQFTYNF